MWIGNFTVHPVHITQIEWTKDDPFSSRLIKLEKPGKVVWNERLW